VTSLGDGTLRVNALVLKDEPVVTDLEGRPVGVLLGLKTYERLPRAEEELGDDRAYDEARPKIAAELKAGRFATLAEAEAEYASDRSSPSSRRKWTVPCWWTTCAAPSTKGPEG
jgi:hypothetical protein